MRGEGISSPGYATSLSVDRFQHPEKRASNPSGTRLSNLSNRSASFDHPQFPISADSSIRSLILKYFGAASQRNLGNFATESSTDEHPSSKRLKLKEFTFLRVAETQTKVIIGST
ncbi:hypothetical protein ACP70R_049065 [Stipagrostis hirtigluma subsp. patula]